MENNDIWGGLTVLAVRRRDSWVMVACYAGGTRYLNFAFISLLYFIIFHCHGFLGVFKA